MMAPFHMNVDVFPRSWGVAPINAGSYGRAVRLPDGLPAARSGWVMYRFPPHYYKGNKGSKADPIFAIPVVRL